MVIGFQKEVSPTSMLGEPNKIGYPSINRPWLKYYSDDAINSALPKKTAFEYLYDRNQDNMDSIALDYYDRKITYDELFERIKQAAVSFRNIGVSAGDVVTIVSVTIPELIYSFYALNYLGAISNLVDPRTSAEGIRDYIIDCNSKYIVTIDLAYQKVLESINGLSVTNVVIISPSDSLTGIKRIGYRLKNRVNTNNAKSIIWKDFISVSEPCSFLCQGKYDDCCSIVHTGGTTGSPKGVMISNYNLNATVIQCDKSGFKFNRDQRWLGIMPPFIAYGVANGLHFPLCIGMMLIIIPAFDPNKYDSLLLKHKPSVIIGVPSHYSNLLNSKKLQGKDLSYIDYPIVGGDSTETGYEKEINAFLQNHHCKSNLVKGYGMTEICAAVTASAMSEYNKIGSVGVPFTHSVVSIFDIETCQEMPFYSEGEVCMQGPHIMMGYYNNESETKHVLRTHEDGTTWLHSGDIGYMDEDGCLFIRGRIKRMIVRHDGFKVFPVVIENVITELEMVKQCGVIGALDPDHSQGKLPFAFIVLAHKKEKLNSVEIIESIKEVCRDSLPEYAQPIGYKILESLPLTNIGKVDYLALEKLAEEENGQTCNR